MSEADACRRRRLRDHREAVRRDAAGALDAGEPVACADLDAEAADAFARRARPARAAGRRADRRRRRRPRPQPDAAASARCRPAGRRSTPASTSYTEKPLAATVSEGARRSSRSPTSCGLRLGCAPDTFLGSAYETSRRLIAEGAIGYAARRERDDARRRARTRGIRTPRCSIAPAAGRCSTSRRTT